jgi:hypothetical protein
MMIKAPSKGESQFFGLLMESLQEVGEAPKLGSRVFIFLALGLVGPEWE